MATEIPMAIKCGGATLRGTLHLANGSTPQPAVVLLHGAGRGDRDSFPAIVESFLAVGVAVVTFDRRGSGESTGAPDMDIERWTQDAGAVHDWAAAQPAIDAGRVALWGHSNGAWVAVRAAAMLTSCEALVLSGASAVTPGRAEAYRRVEDLRPFGIVDDTLEAVHEAWTIVFDCLGSGLWDAARRDRLAAARQVIEADKSLKAVPVPEFARTNPNLDSIPRFDRPPLDGDIGALADSLPWMGYDPIPSLNDADCPALVMLAELDTNCPPGESAALFETAAGRRSAPLTVVVIPGACHSFTIEPRGDRDMSPDAPPPSADELLPEYLDTMTEWLARQLRVDEAV